MKMFSYCEQKKTIYDGQHTSAILKKKSRTYSKFYSWMEPGNAIDQFLADIQKAKNDIRIDIPGKLSCGSDELAKIVDSLQKAKSNGVLVSVRAEIKDNMPFALLPLTKENKGVYNPIAIIDSAVVWFGEPLSGADFILDNKNVPTKYHPIIRMVGKNTAKCLFVFLNMNETLDQDKTNRGEYATDSLEGYILKSCTCKKCGKSMRLRRGKQYFIACTGYPECNESKKLTADLVHKYLFSKSKKGVHCKYCGKSLEAFDGKLGVYVKCCGRDNHKIKLDLI